MKTSLELLRDLIKAWDSNDYDRFADALEAARFAVRKPLTSEDIIRIKRELDTVLPDSLLDRLDRAVACNSYNPDHNGECLNCDEPADAHET
jgi:hypothetical protein